MAPVAAIHNKAQRENRILEIIESHESQDPKTAGEYHELVKTSIKITVQALKADLDSLARENRLGKYSLGNNAAFWPLQTPFADLQAGIQAAKVQLDELKEAGRVATEAMVPLEEERAALQRVPTNAMMAETMQALSAEDAKLTADIAASQAQNEALQPQFKKIEGIYKTDKKTWLLRRQIALGLASHMAEGAKDHQRHQKMGLPLDSPELLAHIEEQDKEMTISSLTLIANFGKRDLKRKRE